MRRPRWRSRQRWSIEPRGTGDACVAPTKAGGARAACVARAIPGHHRRRPRPGGPMRLLPLALALVPLAAAACASRPVSGRPPIPPGVNPQHLHFTDATVGVGDVAPEFELPGTTGDGTISLADFRDKPLVLVFGSHT